MAKRARAGAQPAGARSAAAARGVAQDRPGQAAPRRQEDVGAVPGARANWATTCPKRSNCSPARRGRFSIAGSRATCSRRRWRPTRSSARSLSISSPGSAYVLLHHVMGEAGGARGVWGYVQGGMGGLSDGHCRRPARIWASTSAAKPQVARDLTTSGRARRRAAGRRHADRRRVVASSVDAASDVREVARRRRSCPRSFARRWRGSTTLRRRRRSTWRWPSRRSSPPARRRRSGRTITARCTSGPTLDYLERAYDDAKYGRPSSEPMLEMTLPTSVDATIAPPGKHIMSMFVQYAPYKLAEGNWDDIKEAFADRCIECWPSTPRTCPARSSIGRCSARSTWSGRLRPDRRQHHARGDERRTNSTAAARGRLGRSSHARSRPVSVRRRQPPRRRRDGRCGKNAAEEILRDN